MGFEAYAAMSASMRVAGCVVQGEGYDCLESSIDFSAWGLMG